MNTLAEEHGKLADDLAALDTVLTMFRPDLDLAAIPALQVVNRPVWAKPGETTRAALSILRESNGPLSTDEITAKVAERCGVVPCDRLRHTVYKALDQRRLRGQVVSTGARGFMLWELQRS